MRRARAARRGAGWRCFGSLEEQPEVSGTGEKHKADRRTPQKHRYSSDGCGRMLGVLARPLAVPRHAGARSAHAVRARPLRPHLRSIPLCTAMPGGGKGDARESRRRNAVPRVEPLASPDPLTEASAKQTNRLKEKLAEVHKPPPPAPVPQTDPEWEAWEQYFASCDRAGFLVQALEVRLGY